MKKKISIMILIVLLVAGIFGCNSKKTEIEGLKEKIEEQEKLIKD